MSFPEVKISLDTSEEDLREELYKPCLKWAERFDRGVGYFTSGWLTENLADRVIGKAEEAAILRNAERYLGSDQQR